MDEWLISESAARRIERAQKTCVRPTEEQASAFASRTLAARTDGSPRSITIAGDTAEIAVHGVLTKEPDIWMLIFGEQNTAYSDIIAAISSAEANPAVRKIVLDIDSPGGHVDGLFDTLAALEQASKPITARASEACSAAYAIAAMASKIEAKTAAASFGSVGVAHVVRVDESVVTVTSTEAPEKRPDVTTEEGKASVRKYLDAIHDLFVDAIARGRGTTAAKVNAEFGRGGVVLADEAKRRGMVDAVIKPKLRVVRAEDETRPTAEDDSQPRAVAKPEGPSGTQGVRRMNSLEDLQAQFPALYEAAVARGEERGVAKERSRVSAHIKLGDKTGAVAFAHQAIVEGKSVQDDEVHAEYMTFALNRSDRSARQQESDAAGAAVDGAHGEETERDVGDIVAARLAAKKRSA